MYQNIKIFKYDKKEIDEKVDAYEKQVRSKLMN